MAEPLSIATSAIQVAGVGFKLALTLTSYIESVRKAEKQLQPIADHVRLTSNILNEIASILSNEDFRDLYTQHLLTSTEDALNGCRRQFEELQKFVLKMSAQTSARYIFWFRQKELDILHAHLERFKSSLDLVLAVLNLASSARVVKEVNMVTAMKPSIHRLMQAEEYARCREAYILSSERHINDSGPIQRRRSTDSFSTTSVNLTLEPVSMFTRHMAMKSQTLTDGSNLARNLGPSTSSSESKPKDEVIEQLAKLTRAVARLTTDIEQVAHEWNAGMEYRPGCLQDAFEKTAEAIDAHVLFENIYPENSFSKAYLKTSPQGEQQPPFSPRRTFRERVAHLRKYPHTRPSVPLHEQTSPSAQSRSPVKFASPASERCESGSDGDKNTEKTPTIDERAFQEAIGYARLSFNASYGSSPEDSELEEIPSGVSRSSLWSFDTPSDMEEVMTRVQLDDAHDIVWPHVEDSRGRFDDAKQVSQPEAGVTLKFSSVDTLLRAWTTLEV